jgi:dTDP-4-amino-4,6-dideoxygalactose transaminase
MNVPFVDLNAQYRSICEDIDRVVLDVIASSQFILGPDVRRFEEEFAAYCNARNGVSIDSGTSALELILRALDIGPGDEVITAANTFIATALAILATGAQPVLVDIDPETYTISVDSIAAAITPRTRAVMPVHLYGQPADMDPILDLADRHKLAVVEDACQAHGAFYKGRRAGSMGAAAAFSFYPAKNLGCYGDGGIVVTDSGHIAKRVRMLRDYGQREKYVHVTKGYNHRLDTIQAAVLRVKLPHLDEWNAARRAHARRYHDLLTGSGVILPMEASYAEHVYHLYVIRTAQRDALQAHLKERGIVTGIHYPIPIHLQQACRDLGYKAGDFPITEQCAAKILSLPMYAELTEAQLAEVAQRVREFVMSAQPEALTAA